MPPRRLPPCDLVVWTGLDAASYNSKSEKAHNSDSIFSKLLFSFLAMNLMILRWYEGIDLVSGWQTPTDRPNLSTLYGLRVENDFKDVLMIEKNDIKRITIF